MQMNEIIASDYKRRLDLLDVTLKEKETKIQDIEKNLVDLSKRSKEKNLVSIEPLFEGDLVSVYKKGNVIRFFSQKTEELLVEKDFLKEQLLSLSKDDYIITGVLTKEEETPCFYVTDCFYSKQNLEELAFEDRKKVLDCFNYSDSIRQNGCLFVENQDDANRAISLLSKNSGVCGIMLKDYSRPSKTTIIYTK